MLLQTESFNRYSNSLDVPDSNCAPAQPALMAQCDACDLFLGEQLFCSRDEPLRLEAESFLKLLERRGGTKCLHTDDDAGISDVSFPSER